MNKDIQEKLQAQALHIFSEFADKVHLNERYGDTAQGWADFVTEDLFEFEHIPELDYENTELEAEVFRFLTDYFKTLHQFQVVSLTQFAKDCPDYSRTSIEKLLDNNDVPEEYYAYQGNRTYINPRLSLWLDQVYPLKELDS